nr:retrovirus-related Pol polyprotein from transposon TNT 1-94 [Tanacetum cinerariifolium]
MVVSSSSTDDKLTEKELKQIKADDQAIQTILLGLNEDIYAAVDSCETAQEIWLRVQQIMKGSDIGIQEKKAKLFNEWERFTSTYGESIESYYHRFLKLMNDLKRNKQFPEKIANYTQLYDFLKYNQKEVDDLRAERIAKTQDPLALMETFNNPYTFPVLHQDQPSFNQNYMQQPMPNPKDITDPTTAINMALSLMAKAFKLNYSTPTNNNQRISSNPRNRNLNGYNVVQNVGNQIVQNAVQNQRVKNVGNQNGLIVVPGIANQNPNRNDNLVAARTEGNATGHNDLDEIEKVNANCILMANLQQASTSGTQTDKAPVYDSDGSAEVHNYENCYDDEIFNMFTQEEQYTELLEPIPESHQVPQNDNNVISEVSSVEQSGETVEQHPANIEETCVLYDSLYNNLAIEVEKVNTVNRNLRETNVELTIELARYKNQEKCFEISQEKYDKPERCYQKSVYQEQSLSKKIDALHLSSEKKRLKSDFKIREDELFDKQIQLENKIKELDNILVKTDTHNWSSSAHQELHKIIKDEIFPIVNQVDARVQNFEIQFLKEAAKFVRDSKSLAKEADESLTKHKALELETERLLKAVVSQDIMSVVQNNYNDWYKKCEECKFEKISYDKAYNDMQQKIERVQAQLGDLKGKSKDTSCVSDTLNPLSQKLENENVELEFQVPEQKDTTRGTSVNTKFAKQSILGKPPSSSKTKLYTVSQISKSTVSPKVGVDNTKIEMPQPRSNTKNDRVPSASKSSCSKNKEVEVEEHSRNLLLSKNKKHMSSECNNVKLPPHNVKSKVVCAMCNQCLIYVNHDVCLLNYVNDMNSRGYPNMLWCLDSGCSKHMTGNLKLLINFVWKFLGAVRFGNDHIAAILGFGDLQWGNILITRVYFVEGLGHNLFSVGQFCDSNLERLHLLHMDLCGPMRIASINGKCVGISHQVSSVRTPKQNGVVERRNQTLVEAARTMLIFYRAPLFLWAEAIATACFTQNRSIIHLRFHKTPYELINGRKPYISFLYVFGALCYPKNDREDIGKLGAKGDNGFFIGYSVDSCAYRVYNRRTKKIIETMNVSFDELSAMAFEQIMSTMEPKNVKEAMTDPVWIESMQEELLQFKRLDVWVLVPAPDNITPLTLKWLFKNKNDEENTVIQNKSHRQEEGIDFEESFAQVARMEAIRIFLDHLYTLINHHHL